MKKELWRKTLNSCELCIYLYLCNANIACNAKISKIFKYSKWAADKLSPTSQQPLQGSGSYPNTEKPMTE